MHTNKSFRSFLIQFKDAESANALKTWFDNSFHRQHRIEYCWVDVSDAQLLCQPDFQQECLYGIYTPVSHTLYEIFNVYLY